MSHLRAGENPSFVIGIKPQSNAFETTSCYANRAISAAALQRNGFEVMPRQAINVCGGIEVH